MPRKVRSGSWAQKSGTRCGPHVARAGPNPERQELGRPQESCGCHPGLGWCPQDEEIGNSPVYSNFWLILLLAFLFLYDNFNFVHFVSNDYKIMTQNGQRKKHPETDDHQPGEGQI